MKLQAIKKALKAASKLNIGGNEQKVLAQIIKTMDGVEEIGMEAFADCAVQAGLDRQVGIDLFELVDTLVF